MNTTYSVLGLLITGAFSLGAAAPPVPVFEAVEIDGQIKIGYGLAVADVDGDGRDDILLVDKDQVVWYRNPTWKKHVMAEKLTDRDHVCIAALDINGDGRAEVAVGAEWNPGDTQNSGAVFFLEAPEDRTKLWKPIRLTHEPTTHRMHWVQDWQKDYRLVVLPLHGRGNQGGQGDGVKLLGYRVPDDLEKAWETRLIDGSLHMTHNFDPVQWDDDPAGELLVASREGTFLINWAEGGFKKFPIGGDEGGGAGEVRLGHLAGGQSCVVTIEPMHGSQFVAYTRPKTDAAHPLWNRRVVDESLVDGHAIAAGDVLGTGSDQYMVGWRAMNRPPNVKVGIKLFTPLDDEGATWRQDLIDDNTMACEDLKLSDLDGDGRLDMVAAGRATKNVKIYWNKTGK